MPIRHQSDWTRLRAGFDKLQTLVQRPLQGSRGLESIIRPVGGSGLSRISSCRLTAPSDRKTGRARPSGIPLISTLVCFAHWFLLVFLSLCPSSGLWRRATIKARIGAVRCDMLKERTFYSLSHDLSDILIVLHVKRWGILTRI